MKWKRRIVAAATMALAGLLALHVPAGRIAAQVPRPATEPGRQTLPAPLPARRANEPGGANIDESKAISPIPPSPPPIIRPEMQPIDLDTALRLAGVQNPELNLARQRVLESVAMRQLAAAKFLPSINPGMNYDTHTGNLQQSNGNILSVNRSAVYVGAGSMAIAASTLAIPGVFLGG
ncbi:MAG: hypothetical protein ACP5XB_11900, partial [Isosphaeraceae bacterium]